MMLPNPVLHHLRLRLKEGLLGLSECAHDRERERLSFIYCIKYDMLHPRGVHRTIHVHIDISSSTNTVHGHLQYTAHVLGHISGERHRGKINICLTRYMST